MGPASPPLCPKICQLGRGNRAGRQRQREYNEARCLGLKCRSIKPPRLYQPDPEF